MEELKDKLIKSCSSFAVEPLQAAIDDLSEEEAIDSLHLNGNSKRLFNKRVQLMQVFALCEALSEDSHIVHLDLSYNFLNDMAAKALAGLLKANTTLRVLNLAGNDLTATGAQHLAEALSRPGAALAGLILRGNPLGDLGIMELAQVLRTNTSLQALDLGQTDCGLKGLVGLASDIAEANTTLQALDLESPLIKTPQDQTVLHLCRMLAASPAFTELSLAKHGLTDPQLDTLLTYGLLRSPSGIAVLNLRANKLSPFAGPQIERLLAELHSLRSLNLAHNALGNDGALALARSLPFTHCLQELDIRGNNIGDAGLVALAESLPLATHLRVFLAWGNNFGTAACRAFHDALLGQNSAALAGLRTDVRPYEVAGGQAMVALEEVDEAAV